MTRSESREQAFIILFEKLFRDDNIDEIIALAREYRDFALSEFAKKLILTACENETDIDARIEKYAKGWKKNRMSKVSLSLLRLSIGEILYFDDIPIGASINEAVELCKKYGGEEDFAFVNGILGSIAKEIDKNVTRQGAVRDTEVKE